MTKRDDTIKFKMIMWMGENEWIIENAPTEGFSIEFFYELFSKRFEGLTRLHFEQLLRKLEEEEMVELQRDGGNRVEAIRGLTAAANNLYHFFNK